MPLLIYKKNAAKWMRQRKEIILQSSEENVNDQKHTLFVQWSVKRMLIDVICDSRGHARLVILQDKKVHKVQDPKLEEV